MEDEKPLVSSLNDIVDHRNVAELLADDVLASIGARVVEGCKADNDSRKDWLDKTNEWVALATQVSKTKTDPWPDCANIKYPLLTTAAVQFASRAYPALIPGVNVVKGRVVGFDPDGSKAGAADRVGKYMSHQVLEEIPDWEEDMDRLCIILPIVGCAFKKTYFADGRIYSSLVSADDLVVDYWAKSLEAASRITHIIRMPQNTLRERQLSGLFLDVDLGAPSTPAEGYASPSTGGAPPPATDESTPYILLEQHRRLDLDGDGYGEPYVVTVEERTRKVLRIVARFDPEGIIMVGDKVVRVEPVHYFTMFSFIPNPDGGFYDIGFGALMGPINESINTIVNQLVDSGTLSNLQSGFIGRGVRLRGGIIRFKPGEWKQVDMMGDDIGKNIFPMPVREPSQTLFQLLGLLVDGGQRVGSVTDPFSGEMPGQNTPATTTVSVIEQGMKVFSGIYKRIHRACKREFRKIFRLNGLHLPPETYFRLLDSPDTSDAMKTGFSDFNAADIRVIPYADPNVVTEAQRLSKAQVAFELANAGMANKGMAAAMIVDASDLPNKEALLQLPEPPPDPLVEVERMKVQTNAQIKVAELELDRERLQFDREKLALEQGRAATDRAKAEAEVLKLRADAMLASEKAHAVGEESRNPRPAKRRRIKEHEDGSMEMTEE